MDPVLAVTAGRCGPGGSKASFLLFTHVEKSPWLGVSIPWVLVKVKSCYGEEDSLLRTLSSGLRCLLSG